MRRYARDAAIRDVRAVVDGELPKVAAVLGDVSHGQVAHLLAVIQVQASQLSAGRSEHGETLQREREERHTLLQAPGGHCGRQLLVASLVRLTPCDTCSFRFSLSVFSFPSTQHAARARFFSVASVTISHSDRSIEVASGVCAHTSARAGSQRRGQARKESDVASCHE